MHTAQQYGLKVTTMAKYNLPENPNVTSTNLLKEFFSLSITFLSILLVGYFILKLSFGIILDHFEDEITGV